MDSQDICGETFHDGDMVSGIYEDCSIRLKKVRVTCCGSSSRTSTIASRKMKAAWNHTSIRNWRLWSVSKITFAEDAWEEYLYWQSQDKKH